MTTSTSSGYLGDILAQPQQLRGLVAGDITAAAEPVSRKVGSYRRIVLTGMGASLAALRPLWLTLVAGGHPAWLLETAEILTSCPQLIDSSTLVIAASQSGQSAELVALANEADKSGATLLAITNNAGSALGRAAAATIDIRAGEESTVSTKTYVNTLAVGLVLGRVFTGQPLDDILPRTADALETYLQGWAEHIASLRATIGLPGRLYFLGRGASLAAAECGALITKEAAKWPVEAQSAAQFRHGPLELADEQLSVLLLAGADDKVRSLNQSLAADLTGYGAKVFWLDTGPGGGPLDLPLTTAEARPLLEIAPLQLLTIAIAEATGVEPGVFRHLSKVTTVL